MSDIRRTHPGYWNVTLGCALPWYIGLGIGFTFFSNSKLTSAMAYKLVESYIPLQAWGIAYLLLGMGLLIACTAPKVPHIYVRIFSFIGLIFTTFWVVNFLVSGFIGQLDAVSVIPAWLTISVMEWAAVKEPIHGPKFCQDRRDT